MAHGLILLLFLFISGGAYAKEKRYAPPKLEGKDVVFLETFDEGWEKTWVKSEDPRYTGEWSVSETEETPIGLPGDQGLVMDGPPHHAISALFPRRLNNANKELVIQYEVRFQKGIDCAGAYLKLITADTTFKQSKFSIDTPYTIMFGPDKCSEDKVHFIIYVQNPVTKHWNEHHLRGRPHVKLDKLTHLYTAHLLRNNTLNIYIDQELVRTASLLKNFEPQILPVKMVSDPTDVKPDNWVDDEFLDDLEAVKPRDWDDRPRIPDPKAVKPLDKEDDQEYVRDPLAKKPEEWLDEEDGAWVAPLIRNPKCAEGKCAKWTPPTIPNPKYKGIWEPPKIRNPRYKGPWQARLVQNPMYYPNPHPYKLDSMIGVGFELMTRTDGIMFDNILVTYNKSIADDFAQKTWVIKHAEEQRQQDEIDNADLVAWDQQHNDGFLITCQRYYDICVDSLIENQLLVGISLAVSLTLIVVSCLWPSLHPKAQPPVTRVPKQAAKVKAEVRVAEKKKEKEKEVEDEDGSEDEEIVIDDAGKVKERKQKKKSTKREERSEDIHDKNTRQADAVARKRTTRTPRAV